MSDPENRHIEEARQLALRALDEDAADALRATLRYWMDMRERLPGEPFPIGYLIGHMGGSAKERKARSER
jgi:hypothetical protein